MFMKQKVYIILKYKTFIFGYFEVKWKILEKNALQCSGSEIFSVNSVQTAMFRAPFEHIRAGNKKSA